MKNTIERMFLFGIFWCFFFIVQGYAGDIVIVDKNWKVSFIEADKAFRVNALRSDGTSRKCLFTRSASEVRYDNVEGIARKVSTSSFACVTQTEAEIEDEFGKGKCYTFTFTEPDNGDDVCMEQRFYVYEGYSYLITDLSIIGAETIRSNYLAPIRVNKMYTLFLESASNRMLKVPFENDAWQRYYKYQLNREMISYEVSALFDGEKGEGMVLGSIEHDHWKSAVKVKAWGNGKIDSLFVFSGVSTPETRDSIPHGKLDGPTITSARMFIDYTDDWRKSMEAYGHANTLIQPMRKTWTKGTPFGWQSWGVLSGSNSFATDMEISDYYNDVLRPAGFCNSQGLQIIGLDAGDNLNDTERQQLIQRAEANGQVVGIYCTPFVMWGWSEEALYTQEYLGYKGIDFVLKVNGKPHKFNNISGGYCMDPTHPVTKQHMANFIKDIKKKGIKYVKMDFLTHGIAQADSYFNKKTKTAVEAYTNGMNYICKMADEGDEPLFLSFSIAPLFPYQHGDARRIGCDTWADIGQTEFNMSAISGGWWTNQFYQYNDPDNIVMVGTDDSGYNSKNCTEGENRARFTSGAVTGMMLVADNFALMDQSGRGDPVKSRSRARQIMMNKDINEMADLGRSFMPVYGHKEYGGEGTAEHSFMYHTDMYLYVAVFNYSDNESFAGGIPLADLGISREEFDSVKELWSGATVEVEDELKYEVPTKDVKVFRFHKSRSSIKDLAEEREDHDFEVQVNENEMMVTASIPMRKLEVFDMSGRLLHSLDCGGLSTIHVDTGEAQGVLLVRVKTHNGSILLKKVVVR